MGAKRDPYPKVWTMSLMLMLTNSLTKNALSIPR